MNFGECIDKRIDDFDTNFASDEDLTEIIIDLLELLSILNDRINRLVDERNE